MSIYIAARFRVNVPLMLFNVPPPAHSSLKYQEPTVPDMKVRGQLACPGVKKKYKKKCCLVYICLLYMFCHAPMMFTCIKVLSRLVVKGGCSVKYESLGQQQAAGWAKTNKVDTR
jgi:hypothetical protein